MPIDFSLELKVLSTLRDWALGWQRTILMPSGRLGGDMNLACALLVSLVPTEAHEGASLVSCIDRVIFCKHCV